jgi:exosortase
MADSVQVAPLVVQKQSGFFARLPSWQGVTLLLLLVLLYANILARLFTQWMNDKNFQHGIFVPAFALFVLWKNRNELKKIAPAPSWVGLPILIGGLILLMLGEFGAELFLSRVSLLFLLAGLVILFHGWPLFRAVLFPWAFLILMIPIPVIVFQKVTFPLQLLASKLASTALPLFGVVVHREGNVIELANMKLEVVAACSGIRSLLSLLTLSIIYGYLMEDRQWVRVLLAIAAVPIAVVANSFRIVGTGLLVQYWDPDKAEGFFHLFEGWLIFVVSLIMLFALHGLVMRIWKSPAQHPHNQMRPA